MMSTTSAALTREGSGFLLWNICPSDGNSIKKGWGAAALWGAWGPWPWLRGPGSRHLDPPSPHKWMHSLNIIRKGIPFNGL